MAHRHISGDPWDTDGDSEDRVLRGSLWAMFVGLNDYVDPSWPNLKFAEADAAALAELFRNPRACGYSGGNVDIFITSAKERSLQPTFGNLLAGIERLARNAAAEDLILPVISPSPVRSGRPTGGKQLLGLAPLPRVPGIGRLTSRRPSSLRERPAGPPVVWLLADSPID